MDEVENMERLPECLISLHQTVEDLNNKLKSSQLKFNFISPKDFLIMIKQYQALRKELFIKINEQLSHISKGLIILKNTEKSVQELDKSLQEFQLNLNQNVQIANEKMEMI